MARTLYDTRTVREKIQVAIGCKKTSSNMYVKEAAYDELTNYIAYRPLLYMTNEKTKHVVYISKDYIRWSNKDVLDKLLNDKYYAFSINELKKTFPEEYAAEFDLRRYWYGYRHLSSNQARYGNLYVETIIGTFYMNGLNINTAVNNQNISNTSYSQMQYVYLPNSTMNIMQEFFINKDVPQLVRMQTFSAWYQDDDYFLEADESMYAGHDYGMIIDLTRFTVNKKYDQIDYSYKYQLQVDPLDTSDPHESYDSDCCLYTYPCCYKSYETFTRLTAYTFDLSRPDFSTKYADFLTKLQKYNNKQKEKYDKLYTELYVSERNSDIFTFTVSYQNKTAFNIYNIYTADLNKFTLSGKEDAVDLLSKIVKGSLDDFVIMDYYYSKLYFNPKALKNMTIKPKITLETSNKYYDKNTYLVFKTGNRKFQIVASQEIIDKLKESEIIDEDTCNELKCQLILIK